MLCIITLYIIGIKLRLITHIQSRTAAARQRRIAPSGFDFNSSGYFKFGIGRQFKQRPAVIFAIAVAVVIPPADINISGRRRTAGIAHIKAGTPEQINIAQRSRPSHINIRIRRRSVILFAFNIQLVNSRKIRSPFNIQRCFVNRHLGGLAG